PAAAPKTRNPMAKTSSKELLLLRRRRAASLVSFGPSDEDIAAASRRSKAFPALEEYHVYPGITRPFLAAWRRCGSDVQLAVATFDSEPCTRSSCTWGPRGRYADWRGGAGGRGGEGGWGAAGGGGRRGATGGVEDQSACDRSLSHLAGLGTPPASP